MDPKGLLVKSPNRKQKNPVQISPITDLWPESRGPGTWTCRNAACKAVLSIVDTFCKRCSCCICHLFDDNKDPSLWLTCTSDSTLGPCGFSCHVECAFQQRKVGVADCDGSYCCAACGKVSGILRFWMKQLTIAKDCRRVNSLCYRVYTSFRLLDGASRFQELHEYVKQAKAKLESEVGPLDGVRAKLARGLVLRLSVAKEVQALCDAAIQKAEETSDGVVTVPQNEGPAGTKDLEPDSRLEIGGHGKPLQLTWVDTSGLESSGRGQKVKPNTSKADRSPSKSNGLDLNVVTFPDPNEDVAPNNPPMDKADHRSGGSENWAQHGPTEEVPAVKSGAGVSRKRPANAEAHDSDGVSRKRPANAEAHDSASAMVPMSPLPAHTGGPDDMDQEFAYCVKVIRELEREGHIKKEFRLKLLTWLALRATERGKLVVSTFFRTLGDDPSSLAAQLVHTFEDVVTK